MKVYVASKFENMEAVRAAHKVLRDRGHRITHDWTNECADGLEGTELHRYLRDCAAHDVSGVMNADAVVLLFHEGMRGAWIEFGIGLGLGLHLVTVGAKPGHFDMPGSCIFLELPYVKNVATVEEAAAYLDAKDGR